MEFIRFFLEFVLPFLYFFRDFLLLLSSISCLYHYLYMYPKMCASEREKDGEVLTYIHESIYIAFESHMEAECEFSNLLHGH